MKQGPKRPRPDGRLSDLVHSIEHNANRLSALRTLDQQLDINLTDLSTLSRLLHALKVLEQPTSISAAARPHVFAQPVLLPSPHLGTSHLQPFLRCCLHVGEVHQQTSRRHDNLDSRCIPLAGIDVDRHKIAGTGR